MDKLYTLALSRIKGIGIKRFLKIINKVGNSQDFWNLTTKDLIQLFGQIIGTKLAYERDAIDIKDIFSKISEKNIKFTTYGSPDYPEILREISDPPIVLFYDGDLKIPQKTITVVGTRRYSDYGKRMVEEFVKELVLNGFCIVSGLAEGIDTLAHKAALENNGRTIAVMGTPIGKPFPASNRNLYNELVSNNLVLSEQWFEDIVGPENFALRNRILAGLSKSTLVIEAPERSGALITAHLAFDYNREVFAVPGDLTYKRSAGCNNLIRSQKAQLVTSPDEIISYLDPDHEHKKNTPKPPDIKGFEEVLYNMIYNEPLTSESMREKFDIDTSKLIASLVSLEVKGYVYKDVLERYHTSQESVVRSL